MTIAERPGPRRLEFTTTNPLRAREFLDQTYGWRLLAAGARDLRTELTVTHVDTGSFAVSDVALPADLKFEVAGRDSLMVGTVIEGTVQAERAQGTDRYQPGDVRIGSFPQTGYICHTHSLRDHNFALPVSLLYAVADDEHTQSAPLRFLSPHPASPAARTQWRNTSNYVDSLLGNSEAATSPLVISNMARLLAATALAVFPNTATCDPAARDHRDASTVTLRRAIAFIDGHAGCDISVTDIAAAANVTARAVQLAFRRHLDTTPVAYLRRVRLARAHAELLAADRASASVTTVAYRWGFSSPSRFAASYRRAYGVMPSDTLRQGLARLEAGLTRLAGHSAVVGDPAGTPPDETADINAYPQNVLNSPAARWVAGVAYHCYAATPAR